MDATYPGLDPWSNSTLALIERNKREWEAWQSAHKTTYAPVNLRTKCQKQRAGWTMFGVTLSRMSVLILAHTWFEARDLLRIVSGWQDFMGASVKEVPDGQVAVEQQWVLLEPGPKGAVEVFEATRGFYCLSSVHRRDNPRLTSPGLWKPVALQRGRDLIGVAD